MRSTHSSSPITGQEPALGGGGGPDFSGMEPLLGGLRRAEADLSRIEAILNASSIEECTGIFVHVRRLGQTGVYVRELIQAVPPQARHRIGNWRGTFTLSQRCRAIDALGHLGGSESIPVLLGSLSDSTYQVRQASEDALGAIFSRMNPADPSMRPAVEMLIRSLQVFSLRARKVVARILAALPPDVVLGPLLLDALSAADWWVRREAAWILGKVGDRRATVRLVNALKDSSAAVRASAAWALGQLDAPVAIQPLEEALADRDEVVRAAVVGALGTQIARLPDGDERFRPSLDCLVDVLETDHDLSVRTAVIDALSAIDVPEAKVMLQAVLNRK